MQKFEPHPLRYGCRVRFLLFLFLYALHIAEIDIISLTAILEAVNAASQYASLTLAVGHKDLVVEVGDELAYGRGLLCVDVSAPENGIARRLSTSDAVGPALELTLYLPQYTFRVALQWAVDARLSANINRLQNGVSLLAAPVKDH